MMPYIKKDRRDELDGGLDFSNNIGELNYVITRVIMYYLEDIDSGNGPANYEKYNSVIGMLSCIQLELYRRKIAEYEDRKIKENGDVY